MSALPASSILHSVGKLAPALNSSPMSEAGKLKLNALCSGLGAPADQVRSALASFELLASTWKNSPVGREPRWPSDITDDHTPFEFSLAFSDGRTNIRLLVEAQGGRHGGLAMWDAALQINELLAKQPSVSLERFEAIRDLFVPDERLPARFALWHSAVIDPVGKIFYKVYLNPQVLGSAAAPALVQEALQRLGLGRAWPRLRAFLSRGAGQNELAYLSLDLTESVEARVKVYVAHRAITALELEAQLREFPSYIHARASSFVEATTRSPGPFLRRPLLTCLNYSGTEHEPSLTLHVPVRCYSENDEVSLQRIRELLSVDDGRALSSALRAFSDRPLESDCGIVTYASESYVGNCRRLVIYASPELYLQGARSSPAPAVRSA